MAIKGPPPKPPEKRARRNKDELSPQVELGHGRSPSKIPALPNAAKLRAATRKWYRTWATSPQATQFIATDWQRLHMLAPVVDRYYREQDPKLLAMIISAESKLGATAEDRLRLRWRLAGARKAEEAEAEKPTGKAAREAAATSAAHKDPRLKLVGGS